jgi:serine/threonine protein phosphatase PrpC
MICPVCGTENRDGARFCRGCGKNLAEVEAEVQAKVEDKTEAEIQAEAEAAVEAEAEVQADAEVQAEGEAEMRIQAEGEAETKTEVEAEAEAETEVEARGEAQDEQEAAGPEPALASPLAEGDDVSGFWRDQADPLAPAEPGTVIAGRYVLVEALDVQEDEILYLARDLQKCWQCGFEDNAPDEAFCARCGASLERKRDAHLVQVHDATARPSGDEAGAVWLEDEGRHFLLLAEPEPEAQSQAPAARRSIRLLVGQRSDAGQLRELDEDSLLALTLAPTYESQTGPVLGLFAVADGMGGHEGGEVASKMALQILAGRGLRTVILPELTGETIREEDITARLRQAAEAANDAVYLARQKAGNDMGTTLTVAYVRDERLFLAHVGDCRAYCWNAAGLEQLTTDHSVVASMIASGQAAPEEIYTHPHRSVIYRCIGDKPAVDVDSSLLSLAPGDRLVLCCDGLWEMIRSEGIADVLMQEADPQVACDVMVKRANAAGGDDNISVIVVQIEAV